MKAISTLIALFFFAGCETTKPDWGKYRGTDNIIPRRSATTQTIGLIEKDYLVSELIRSMNEAGQVNYIEPNKTYYQAYDPNFPEVSPVFYSKNDAHEYARLNNYNHYDNQPTGHAYIVKPINHRFEVRMSNAIENNVLFTCHLLKDAEQYVGFFKESHSDLLIYDLIEQDIVGINTP
jgi:hypothetical protein